MASRINAEEASAYVTSRLYGLKDKGLLQAGALHDLAMDCCDVATLARLSNDMDKSRAYLYQAYLLEMKAARLVAVEPSRSILYRSAASLALEIGAHEAARNLAVEGLKGDPTPQLQSELKEVLNKTVDAS